MGGDWGVVLDVGKLGPVWPFATLGFGGGGGAGPGSILVGFYRRESHFLRVTIKEHTPRRHPWETPPVFLRVTIKGPPGHTTEKLPNQRTTQQKDTLALGSSHHRSPSQAMN